MAIRIGWLYTVADQDGLSTQAGHAPLPMSE